MDYYCEIWDKSNKIQSKRIYLNSISHFEFEKSNLIFHTVKNPNFLDVDKIYNYYINIHNKNLDL